MKYKKMYILWPNTLKFNINSSNATSVIIFQYPDEYLALLICLSKNLRFTGMDFYAIKKIKVCKYLCY